jgi:hypothetical protein
MNPSYKSSQIGEKSLLAIQKISAKNKECLALIWSLNPRVFNKIFSKKQHYRLFKVSFKDIMELFLLMGRLELVRPIRWREAKLNKLTEA